MKKDKLFEECLAKVDPEVKAEVRRQMDFALMGLPTDEEICDHYRYYDNEMLMMEGAKWMRDIAYKLLKERRAIDIEKAYQWLWANVPCDLWIDLFRVAMETNEKVIYHEPVFGKIKPPEYELEVTPIKQ